MTRLYVRPRHAEMTSPGRMMLTRPPRCRRFLDIMALARCCSSAITFESQLFLERAFCYPCLSPTDGRPRRRREVLDCSRVVAAFHAHDMGIPHSCRCLANTSMAKFLAQLWRCTPLVLRANTAKQSWSKYREQEAASRGKSRICFEQVIGARHFDGSRNVTCFNHRAT